MKIKYLKQINGFKAGDTDDVPDERANYFIQVGAAEEVKRKANEMNKQEQKKMLDIHIEKKPKTQTKSPAKKKSK